MGQCYGQLSLEERIEIYRLRSAGKSMQLIARTLERHVSTISREIGRNSMATKVWSGGYAPARAQKLAERRRRWDGRFKLARQPDLRDLVKDRLAMGHSPEQIAGRLTLEHGHTVISHKSIYRFIYHRSAQKDYWHRLLPRRKLLRGRRGRRGGSPASFIKQRRSITERPADVEGRNTPGHWEADFMLFARYGQGLLVLHEHSQPVDHAAKAAPLQYIAQHLCSIANACDYWIPAFAGMTSVAEGTTSPNPVSSTR